MEEELAKIAQILKEIHHLLGFISIVSLATFFVLFYKNCSGD